MQVRENTHRLESYLCDPDVVLSNYRNRVSIDRGEGVNLLNV